MFLSLHTLQHVSPQEYSIYEKKPIVKGEKKHG